MCWNLQVSLASACVGWVTCLYLLHRNRSERDRWYALYLVTFTFTQIVDAFLWSMNDKSVSLGENGLHACKSYQLQFGGAPTDENEYMNFFVSKYFIPMIVFSQHATQLMYPSEEYKKNPEGQHKIIAIHSIPCIIMSFCFGCTMLTDAKFPYADKTLFWGGDFSDYPFSLIQVGATLHSGLVAAGFSLFCRMKGPVLWAHLLPLACVVSLLWITEGRMDFGSKWCTYCLIYSAVYICEPIWFPDGAAKDAISSKAKVEKNLNITSKKSKKKINTPAPAPMTAAVPPPAKKIGRARVKKEETTVKLSTSDYRKMLRQRTPAKTRQSQEETTY